MTAAAVPRDTSSPVTLVYIRAPGTDIGPLDKHLESIARRFPQVELLIVDGSAVDAVVARRGPTPALLVLRRGVLVGECTGLLPAREIEEVVRCAVEWPFDGEAPLPPRAR